MKKCILICAFIISFSGLNAQSWVYHPFPVTDAMWHENSGEVTCNCCRNYDITIDGDSVIGSNVYHKLKWGGIIYYNPNPAIGPWWTNFYGCSGSPSYNYLNSYVDVSYAGCFREDIPNKKIYYLEAGQTTDTLLYDFNLNVGDTLPPSYGNNPSLSPYNIVSSIDSVLVGAVYHKRFNIVQTSTTPYVSLIEGVGSTFGLLAYLMTPFEAEAYLNCFSVSGVGLYPSGTSCNPLPLTVREEKGSDKLINVFPNPTAGKFKIQLIHEEEINLVVTDLLGNLVQSKIMKSNRDDVDLSDMKPGVYFVRITDMEGNTVIKKIVKQ